MNTIGSVYYGWAFFICCGAGSYYFAKRSINADRAERQALENDRRQRRNREIRMRGEFEQHKGPKSPAGEASGSDPAPTRPPAFEKSKFEASEPYRSPKGDRLSGRKDL